MNEQKICVVSMIGKSQLLPNQTKAWKLNSLLGRNCFKSELNIDSTCWSSLAGLQIDDKKPKASREPNIQTYYDQKHRVLYLNLESVYDVNNILDMTLKNAQATTTTTESKSFFEMWESEQVKYFKSVLLLFSLSHIIVISNPSCEFDINYIRFFRIIDLIRTKMAPSLTELLKSLDVDVGKEWIYASRPCSPRVLFLFENYPRDLIDQSASSKSKSATFKKLQHSLEDQIYNSLRKSYVITNISNNSLFAIPANQEFVYIHRLVQDPTNMTAYLQNDSYFPSQSDPFKDVKAANISDEDTRLFRKFIVEHINTAFGPGGFNDNIGRTNVAPVFELPTKAIWDRVYDAFIKLFFHNISPTLPVPNKLLSAAKINNYFAQFKSHIDIDAQFSENKCKKVLQNAVSLYQENMPVHYTELQHQQRLEKALSLYHANARGPMFTHYLNRLRSECANIWQNGRQLCEAVSLTGHSCVYELHRVPAEHQNDDHASENEEEDDKKSTGSSSARQDDRSSRKNNENSQESVVDADQNRSRSTSIKLPSNKPNKKQSQQQAKTPKLPIKSHNSNIFTRGASNCGEFQRERKDPFDLADANFNFYNDFNTMEFISKRALVKYEFPVYSNTKDEEEDETNKQSSPAPSAQTSYLKGMTNSDSPAGLLPRFSSWSLICIGKYSDYSAHSGLAQPGFLPNYNFLIPWDISVAKNTVTSLLDKKSARKRGNNSKNSESSDNPTSSSALGSNTPAAGVIRTYIGCEYECPCGHRFICSGPDRLVKASSNGVVKDDAYKLLNMDMPLYTACPCRKDSTPYMAQMMRVFIATPAIAQKFKTFNTDLNGISIAINPRVQPNPQPCPIFFPSQPGPIQLAENSLWVFRLPYIYMGEDLKPFYRPTDFETLNNCKVIKGMFSILTEN